MRLIRVGLIDLWSCTLQNRRGARATTPDRHVTRCVRWVDVASVDRGVNSTHWKHASVFPRQHGQIRRLCRELHAQWAISLAGIVVARRAMRQVLHLWLVNALKALIHVSMPAIVSHFTPFSMLPLWKNRTGATFTSTPTIAQRCGGIGDGDSTTMTAWHHSPALPRQPVGGGELASRVQGGNRRRAANITSCMALVKNSGSVATKCASARNCRVETWA
jgi:hypothetical protein